MNKIHEWVNTILIIIVGALVLVGGNDQSVALGGITNFDQVDAADGFSVDGTTIISGAGNFSLSGSNTLTLGTSGTAHTKFISGSCNASQKTPGSLSATTTGEFYCAVTGAASGDKVFVSLPIGAGPNSAGAGSGGQGGFIAAASYATSSNFIGFDIYNGTGAATSSFAQATTTVTYWVVDN